MLKQGINIFKGRINRKQYIVGLILFELIKNILILISLSTTFFLIQYIILAVSFLNFLFYLSLHFKRTKDIGWEPLPFIITLIILFFGPIVILFFSTVSVGTELKVIFEAIEKLIIFVLIIYPGSEGTNEFGDSPTKKNLRKALFNYKNRRL